MVNRALTEEVGQFYGFSLHQIAGGGSVELMDHSPSLDFRRVLFYLKHGLLKNSAPFHLFYQV